MICRNLAINHYIKVDILVRYPVSVKAHVCGAMQRKLLIKEYVTASALVPSQFHLQRDGLHPLPQHHHRYPQYGHCQLSWHLNCRTVKSGTGDFDHDQMNSCLELIKSFLLALALEHE
jgi:hypothetical protein